MEERTTFFTPVTAERKSAIVADKIKALILEKRYGPARGYLPKANGPGGSA